MKIFKTLVGNRKLDLSDNPCISTVTASITPFFTVLMISVHVFYRLSKEIRVDQKHLCYFLLKISERLCPGLRAKTFFSPCGFFTHSHRWLNFAIIKGSGRGQQHLRPHLGGRIWGVQRRCLSSLRFTTPTANLSMPPKAKSRGRHGNNFGPTISLCGRPVGWFTGRLASSINRDPRLKMESFCFPRLIIEAECSSLSANAGFDLRRSQHFLSLVGCCSKTNICTRADSRRKMDLLPLFVCR